MAALCMILPLASCSLAPSFLQPEVPLEEAWVGVALKAQQQDALVAHSLDWRDYFQDSQLRQYIGQALEHNHDLRVAALNAELAQAQYRITRSSSLPDVGLDASGRRSRTARDLSPTGEAVTGNVYSVGLGIAAFEFDFFGRVRNERQAMLNDYLQTLEARDAARLSIISAVAKAYFMMRINEEMMRLARSVQQVRQESLELTRLQVDAGTVTEATLQGMLSAIELAKADYEERRRGWLQSRNTLSLLVGRSLSTVESASPAELTAQFPPQELFASLPAEVLLYRPDIRQAELLYRPDIRQAEYALKAVNANIGVARAAFFPSISLTSTIGFGSVELDNLFDGENLTWSFAPRLDLPLFDYGRRRANVKAMEIRQQSISRPYRAPLSISITPLLPVPPLSGSSALSARVMRPLLNACV